MPRILICLTALSALLLTTACTAGYASRSDSSDATMASGSAYDKPGFVTEVQEGRLWVFPVGSADYDEFKRVGEPAKHTTRIGVGPAGMTMKGPDIDTIIHYLAAKPGYYVEMAEGRVWVFAEGSEALADFKTHGEPAKSVTLLGAGPLNTTVRSSDKGVIQAWSANKPGFYTEVVDGRLWVLQEGSEALAEFKASGEPAKSVTMIGAGPNGMTVRSDDKDTIRAWAAHADGFVIFVEDGRVWVFEPGTEALAQYEAVGEPAKHTTRVASGPMGMTVKGPDGVVLDRYLALVN